MNGGIRLGNEASEPTTSRFDGMRVRLYVAARGLPDDAQGTVVGDYQPAGCFLWVRWDVESGPRQMRWHEIRPVNAR